MGVALAAPLDDDPEWDQYLLVLYTYASIHGQGAGSALLASVVDFDRRAALWVADPNPRAQAFYRKHGFHFTTALGVSMGAGQNAWTQQAQNLRGILDK